MNGRFIISEDEAKRIRNLYKLNEQSRFVDTPGEDWEFDKPSYSPLINYPDNWRSLSNQNKLVFVAKQMAEKKIDVSRPAKGTKEVIWKNLTGQEEFKNKTCVKGVCDIYKNAGLSSGIPQDVLDNRTFKESYKKYGYEIIPKEQLKPGDLIQYISSDNNYPYHIGVYVGNYEYVSDGSDEQPIMKKNIYKDEHGNKKDSFIVYRQI